MPIAREQTSERKVARTIEGRAEDRRPAWAE